MTEADGEQQNLCDPKSRLLRLPHLPNLRAFCPTQTAQIYVIPAHIPALLCSPEVPSDDADGTDSSYGAPPRPPS